MKKRNFFIILLLLIVSIAVVFYHLFHIHTESHLQTLSLPSPTPSPMLKSSSANVAIPWSGLSLTSPQFIQVLMQSDAIHPTPRVGWFDLISAASPQMSDLLTGEPIAHKRVHLVGTVQRGQEFFTIVSVEFVGDTCMTCSPGTYYYHYHYDGKQITNLSDAVDLGSAEYQYLQEHDINLDHKKEIFLYAPSAQSWSGVYQWKGFSILEVKDTTLHLLVQIHTHEEALHTGANAGVLSGREFENTWKFLPAQQNGYPNIEVTHQLIKHMPDAPPYPRFTSEVFHYDQVKGEYESDQ